MRLTAPWQCLKEQFFLFFQKSLYVQIKSQKFVEKNRKYNVAFLPIWGKINI